MDADSAASATPNSRWVTLSCSSRARRLRSSTIDSSRLRSCSRAFSIAIAAWAASSEISRSSSAENPSSFSVRYSAPMTSSLDTIGTPRNVCIDGCARGHQPRKRGSALMSSVRCGPGVSNIAPSIPCVRGSGPIAAISSSLIPDVMNDEKRPSPSGMPSAA